jgi:hypothetical protein
VITILVRALHINIGNLQPLVGVRRLSFANLNACSMDKKRQGRYFLVIPGADHLITAPAPNGLFYIEDGRLHYDACVEANLPQQEVPKENDEAEEEEGGPEQEQ